ncbi:MAG: DegT/DnrJ/EryC1/StrS family aminotransferase [Blastocatellia bacterium]
MNNFLPFSLPNLPNHTETESLDSGRLSSGQKTRHLERSMIAFLRSGAGAATPASPSIQTVLFQSIGQSARHPLGHSAGAVTDGLQLALKACGVGAGDEVITSPYTFATTAGILRQLGARPVFVDIDPVTLNIDHRKIERAITERTKVILPVHIGGLACEMEPILDLAWQHALRVVEDAAQALPSTYRERQIGTLGSDATVFRFHRFHLGSVDDAGDGGIIVTCNPEVAARCRELRASDGNLASHPASALNPGSSDSGSDLAAIGIQQMRNSWNFLEQRSRIAARYDAELGDLPVIRPAWAPAGDLHSWHLYILRLNDSLRVTRDEFIRLMAKRGVECSANIVPLHLHPYWRDSYQLQPHQFPVAWRACERVVSLPIHAGMSDDDQGRVIEAVREVVDQVATRPRNSLFFSPHSND